MPAPSPVLVWFRQDLRLSDNPAYQAAVKSGAPVLPVYILDDVSSGDWKMGGASRAWLHHSLNALSKSLNGNLSLYAGDARAIIAELIDHHHIKQVFWNRCYEPWRIARDKDIKHNLTILNIDCQSFNGSLLWEPWEVLKSDGTPYRVFTPFFRKGCVNAGPPRAPLPDIKLPALTKDTLSLSLEQLHLLPQSPRWDSGMMDHWQVGERAAQKQLETFLETGLKGYKEGRNYPTLPHTSRLSPYLHFGEISPHQVWAISAEAGLTLKAENDLDHFQSELAWREFSYSLLYYNPDLPSAPLNKKFEMMEWAKPDAEFLERWQKGQTGYPIVDAGMRELWATGYMHNRVRMIVASFLVKDLRYHWRHGEDWFWDTLVDADLANNATSWQWVAGCGADAAPYFRIFNPTTQGEKFDPNGNYIKRWAPDSYKIKPMVDHKKAREAALEAFKGMK